MLMNICIFCGARPNFIKVAPVIRAIENAHRNGRDINYQLVYAGPANDPTLEDSLFQDLQIPRPNAFLGVECENLNELTGQVMSQFEHYLQQHATHTVIVVDDLASTMAAAIVTKKQGITLAHIAAGTRSFDIAMPKEINRLVIDGLSDMLFTAGISNNSIANREGAELSKVYMVGNILIDNIRFNRERIRRPYWMDELGLQEGAYYVFTLNRKALIGNHENLKQMLAALLLQAENTPVLAPLRALARQAVEQCVAELRAESQLSIDNLLLHEPLSYLDFSYITAHARGVVTDSGNVAEEATFNGVPCITLNSYTEHIETVKVGTNMLVDGDAELLGKAVRQLQQGQWKQAAIPDRWDGRSAERIVQILLG